jgi:hypothetical protein
MFTPFFVARRAPSSAKCKSKLVISNEQRHDFLNAQPV